MAKHKMTAREFAIHWGGYVMFVGTITGTIIGIGQIVELFR